MTDRTGVVPVAMLVVVVMRRDMARLCCSAAKAVKRWSRLKPFCPNCLELCIPLPSQPCQPLKPSNRQQRLMPLQLLQTPRDSSHPGMRLA